PGRPRPRRLVVPPRLEVWHCGTVAGSGAPGTQSNLPLGPGSRLLVRRPIRRSHRPRRRIWSPRPTHASRGLAALDEECLGRAGSADPDAAPFLANIGRAVSPMARAIRPIQASTSGGEARLLPGPPPVALGPPLGSADS